MKLETVAELWYYRSLTLMGKVLVVNTLFTSLFVYKMQVLPPIEENLLLKIETAISQW